MADWSEGLWSLNGGSEMFKSHLMTSTFLKFYSLGHFPAIPDFFRYRVLSKLACLSFHLSEKDRRYVGPVSEMLYVTVWQLKMLLPVCQFPLHLCYYPLASLNNVFLLCIDYVWELCLGNDIASWCPLSILVEKLIVSGELVFGTCLANVLTYLKILLTEKYLLKVPLLLFSKAFNT